MGKLTAFEVILTGNEVDLFRAGDLVEGYVRIACSAPKRGIRGIQVKCEGKAQTEWSEEEKSDDDVKYVSKVKYFEDKKVLAGKDSTYPGADICLEAGEHKYPFRFHIPYLPLPDPYEGEYGYIRYMVKAKIDRPTKFKHETQRLFSVVGVTVDLNQMPELALMPRTQEDEKTVCCLCCESGPIKVHAEIDKTGYVPGETIWMTGFVDNQTNRDIVTCTAKLMQLVTFHALRKGIGKEHIKKEKLKLTEVQGDGCQGYSIVSFDRKPLLVPACPASGLKGCSIINIEYYIEFEADVSGTPFDAEIKLPVIIGTIPLEAAYSAPNTPHLSAQRVITKQPSQISFHLPPSYAVAKGGLQEIPSKSGYDYTFGKLMYAPRYAYYHFPPDMGSPFPGQAIPDGYGPFGPDPHCY